MVGARVVCAGKGVVGIDYQVAEILVSAEFFYFRFQLGQGFRLVVDERYDSAGAPVPFLETGMMHEQGELARQNHREPGVGMRDV